MGGMGGDFPQLNIPKGGRGHEGTSGTHNRHFYEEDLKETCAPAFSEILGSEVMVGTVWHAPDKYH